MPSDLPSARPVAGLLLVAAVLLALVAALPAQAQAPRAPELSVAPVPQEGEPPGEPAVVRWNTGSGAPGEVTVTTEDGVVRLFGSGSTGANEAAFVTAGSRYVFELFQTAPDRRLLARVSIGKTGRSTGEVKAPAAVPGRTPGLINAILLVLPFVGLVAIAGLTASVLLGVRRGA